MEDYYHSVPWLEESVRLFRGSETVWRPENEGSLEDALDHLAFSHFKVDRQACVILHYEFTLTHTGEKIQSFVILCQCL